MARYTQLEFSERILPLMLLLLVGGAFRQEIALGARVERPVSVGKESLVRPTALNSRRRFRI